MLDNVNAIYKDFGIDLLKANGENSQYLPLAVYLIDRDGKIRFDFVEADYKKRVVDKDKLMASLKSLQGKVATLKVYNKLSYKLKRSIAVVVHRLQKKAYGS